MYILFLFLWEKNYTVELSISGVNYMHKLEQQAPPILEHPYDTLPQATHIYWGLLLSSHPPLQPQEVTNFPSVPVTGLFRTCHTNDVISSLWIWLHSLNMCWELSLM